MKTHEYFVYILASRSKNLYTGVTNNLHRRLEEHRSGAASAHTRKYRITRLVHVESTDDVYSAIQREKQIKGWTRAKRVALIERDNPTWRDLSEDLV